MIIGAAVAAVVLLPIAADRIAATTIEHRLAARLQCAAGLATAPDVRLAGFPALTQLAGGSFGEIRVTADDLHLPKVAVGHLAVDARRVRLAGDGATAGSMTADATVPYSALAGLGALGAKESGDLRIVGADGARRLVVQADVTVRGLSFAATVYADLALTGNRLAITPAEVELSSLGLRVPASRLPAAAAEQRTVDLPALPAGLTYRSVTATPDGLRVVVAGTDLHLDRTTGHHGKTCGGTTT
ncbi:LmeA family phospholipid-binding protein [Paractinoplanes durhamensis]|uniref:DUF2993 domain-containing protein n=1 Tax=Paractinoplanes durhamensis TaxID=113563 RepID=A0ABQ3Z0D3_9ACTN|nr:DUF2993 domain-containing protein [Actinoplanes durhamensis]GIE03283.1 hypothetical protein Adu01nite_46330 [Actinoplanes durhamensis]